MDGGKHFASDGPGNTHCAPAGNALKHGMTASLVLPAHLRQRTADLKLALGQELHPASVLESILVHELGRHAAAMELAESGETAAIEMGARHAGLTTTSTEESIDSEAAVVAAINSNATEKTSRYRRGHERTFHAALKAFREMRTNGCPTEGVPIPRFADEAAAEEYLVRHQASRRCQCGGQERTYLAARKRYECRLCGRQAGLREGTILARSQVPLRVWLSATVTLILHPAVRLRELAEELGFARIETLRQMRSKILTALDSADADLLLAGLPALVYSSINCASRAKCPPQYKTNLPPH